MTRVLTPGTIIDETLMRSSAPTVRQATPSHATPRARARHGHATGTPRARHAKPRHGHATGTPRARTRQATHTSEQEKSTGVKDAHAYMRTDPREHTRALAPAARRAQVCQVLVSLALASPSAATTWALASAEVSSRAVCRPLSSAKHCGLTETATAECSAWRHSLCLDRQRHCVALPVASET